MIWVKRLNPHGKIEERYMSPTNVGPPLLQMEQACREAHEGIYFQVPWHNMSI